MIQSWFPADATAEELEDRAWRHAVAWDLKWGRPGASASVPMDRLVVNLLRHIYTDYDDDQSFDRFSQACDAIARRYPWLAEECAHQIGQRATEEEAGWDWDAFGKRRRGGF